MNLSHKAQSLAEYSLVIALVFASILGMQIYVKRGLQARIKTFVDGATQGISSVAKLEKPLTQYEPYYTNSEITTQQMQKIATKYNPGGEVRREWLPVINDDKGDYVEGNLIKKEGKIETKGVSNEDLTQDDAWED